MKDRLTKLLDQFIEIPGVKDLIVTAPHLEFEPGPHTRPRPLKNERGVYVFFRDQVCLRIGQTGYSQRFTSQHYGTRRAGSTFAQDIWLNRRNFDYEGEENLIDMWILQNIGRANIRISDQKTDNVSRLLEAFLQLNLKPRFEGRRSV